MSDARDIDRIIEDVRERSDLTLRRARRRLVLTCTLALLAGGYMTWLHGQLSQLDANAVTEIARHEVQMRLPEMGAHVTQMAIDAAPGVMDRGEAALLAAPSALADGVEERIAARTDALVDAIGEELDAELDAFVGPRLEALEAAAAAGELPSLNELMDELRAQYREKATALTSNMYVEYAREINGVNDYLLHLRDGEHLTHREQIERELIQASVALRNHYVTPIAPVGADDETAAK